MKKRSRIASAFCLFAAVPYLLSSAHAQTEHHFNPEQQKEIISIVHQALKNDPTILEDAVNSLRKSAQEQQDKLASQKLQDNKNLLLQQSPTDGLIGNPDAKITITEFYDPRCPYCKKVLPELFQIVKENKNVKIILKTVPILGENSYLQSQAILAATRQNNYLTMMKSLMTTQETVDLNLIRNIAQQNKLNAPQLLQDMKADSIKNALENNVHLMQELKINGTPAFIINGKQLIPGAINYQTFQEIIKNAS